jgi:hypothetical protein
MRLSEVGDESGNLVAGEPELLKKFTDPGL